MIKKILALLLALFAAAAFAAVDVNTASQTELESVKGIGPAISGKILDERKKGAFKDWPDLVTRVKGVGDKNAAEFSAAGMTVNGAALTGSPANPAAMKKADKAVAKAAPAAPAAAVTPAPAAKVAPAAPALAPAIAPAVAPAATPAATATATAPAAMSAADKKAAAKKEKDDKKAAKAEERVAKKASKAASGASAASAPAKK